MNLTDRDKRALILLAVAAVVFGAVMFATRSSDSSVKIVEPIQSVAHAEKQLDILRRTAATLPARQEVHKQVLNELADREKGLIQADTAAQAQARLVQILREVARNQNPPLDIRQTELGQPRPFGQFYGEVPVSITMDCRTDQLVNFMAFLSAQPELIATEEIRFASGNPKTKVVPVRLTVTGIVARKLVPEKKATSLF